MTKEELLFLRSQHEMAINLAISFMRTTTHHACKEDLDRIIEHNRQCILEIDRGSQIQDSQISG